MRVTTLVGNPKAKSRTLTVAEEVTSHALAAAGVGVGGADRQVVDLADVAPRLFDWGAEDVDVLVKDVAASDLLVVATPTYKASYTGLLKAFLDRYGPDGLAGVVAVPVMVGAAPVHELAVEFHLRPLLVELAASCPTKGLYVMESQFDRLPEVVSRWAEQAGPALSRAVGPGRAG